MIRPATLLSIAAAFGSGLYLYAEKHHAALLDRQIGQVFRATQDAHAQTDELRTEWALLNDPARLQDMAGKYLPLRPIEPAQFVQLEQLADHLPGPGGEAPIAAPPPAAAAPAVVAEADAADAAVPDEPGAGAPAVHAPVASEPPVVSAPASPVREAPPRIARAAPMVPKPVLARPVEALFAHAEPKPRVPHAQVFARAEPPRATTAGFEMTMERLVRQAHAPAAPAVAQAGTGYLPEFKPAPKPAPPVVARTETVVAYAQPVQRPAYPRWAAAQPRFMPQPYYAAAPGYSYAPPGYYGQY